MVEIIALIIAALSVAVAAWYSWLTFRILQTNEKAVAAMTEQALVMKLQVEAMQAQSEANSRPYIGVSPFVFRGGHMIYLRIENDGRTAASNLVLAVDKDFFTWSNPKKNLRSFRVFSHPIQSFPPGSRIVIALGTYGQVFCDGPGHEHGMPREFSITATYTFGSTTYTETTAIDLNQFFNTEPDPDPNVEQLKKIVEALQQLKKA
jgi:hypothetical protein